MKHLPLSIQTFSKLVKGNYLYIDKTEFIYNLLSGGGEYFFLSRPRRFGKSLLISTLAEIFSGNQGLFKGLWIYDRIKWTQYPVIHIDFSKIDYETPEKLKKSIKKFLDETALSYGFTLDEEKSYKESFVELIKKCSSKGRVVVLVDEYDKPMVEYIEANKIEPAKKIRTILKHFYSVIKGSDAFLRFVFITGVSKFSKVSIFSDLNNLIDITLMENYSALLGYTEAELQHYFYPYIEQMSKKLKVSKSHLTQAIQKWYNGYSWDGEHFVYNPFSILNLFNANSFENFWFSSGTPSLLIKLIKSRQSDLEIYENLPVKSYTFDSYDIENMEIAALLFQTGYLTIKKITSKGITRAKTYHLSYPNQEVRESFLTHLFGEYMQKDMSACTQVLERIKEAVEADDIDRFVQEIKSLFASIPYHIFIGEREAYYHSIIYLLLKLNGAVVSCEDSTNIGRIDAVLETANKIYIMEFKVGKGSEQEALEQIKEMKYYEKYLGKGNEIILIGIGFDPEKRNIGNYLLETL
jgi:hypothetical protein